MPVFLLRNKVLEIRELFTRAMSRIFKEVLDSTNTNQSASMLEQHTANRDNTIEKNEETQSTPSISIMHLPKEFRIEVLTWHFRAMVVSKTNIDQKRSPSTGFSVQWVFDRTSRLTDCLPAGSPLCATAPSTGYPINPSSLDA